MVYVLYGTIDYLINKKKDELLDSTNISKYDLTTDDLDIIIKDARSMSLFGDKKIIVIDNAIIFTGKNGIDTTNLEKYLNDINSETILIFIVHNEKLDERKKITKLVKKIGTVFEYNSSDNIEIVKKMFGNYKINEDTIKYLINRVGDNITLLSNEIEKIKIYKNDDLNISIDDINNLTSKSLEINNFKLISAIIDKNKSLAIKLYNERIKLNEEPIAVIIALANQIRIMYQVKQLYMLGYTENKIASFLGIHPYRVKLANINAKHYDSNLLLDYLYQLSNLDINIKLGNIDKTLALELFILSL